MKRFTETSKWSDPWFRRLSPSAKLLWAWILDNCDGAGVIDLDIELAEFQIGLAMGMDTLSELGQRVTKLDCGKYHVPRFIEFQYGMLSPDCKAHNPIFASLQKHGLERYSKGIPKGIHTPQEKEKEKEQEKEKEKDCEIYSPTARAALHFLNEKSGRHYRESESSISVIHARMKEPGVDLDGVKKMIERQCARWKGTPQEEYLRPETLFGKQKFDSYYAAKDLPIQAEKPQGRFKANDSMSGGQLPYSHLPPGGNGL